MGTTIASVTAGTAGARAGYYTWLKVVAACWNVTRIVKAAMAESATGFASESLQSTDAPNGDSNGYSYGVVSDDFTAAITITIG